MSRLKGPFGVVLIIVAVLSVLLMMAPLIIISVSAFDPVSLRFPIKGFTLEWFKELFTNAKFMKSMWTSLKLGLASSLISTVLALFVSIGLRYCPVKARNSINSLMLAPLFVPSIVLGLALYQLTYMMFDSRQFWMLIFGHIVLTLPYPLRTIMAGLESLPKTLDEASMSVGASPLRMVATVLVPNVKPSFFSGWLLAFVQSWNDFNVAIWMSSNKFYPLSIQIYSFTRESFNPMLAAMCVVLVLFSAAIVLLMDKLFGLSTVAGIRTT